MLLVRLIRKFFSLLRSNLTGHEIGLGFCLGILLGCIPISSIWAVLAMFGLIIIFRASFSAFFMAAILVKTFSFVIDPLLFSLGEVALEGGAGGIFTWMVQTPVLALLDLHRYVIAGGILFTLICSVVCYPLFFILTNKYRSSMFRWAETSPRFAKFTNFPLIKFITWLFMGKKKGDYSEAPTRRIPIRKGALIILVSFSLVVWILGMFFGDAVAKAGFETGLSAATNSDVETRALAMSLFKGSLDLENAVVFKRDENKRIINALKFSGDLSVSWLLKRHLVFDEVMIENMDFRLTRFADRRHEVEKGGGKEKSDGEGSEGAGGLSNFLKQEKLARDLIDRLVKYMFEQAKVDDVAACIKKAKESLAFKDFDEIYADFMLEKDQPFLVVDDLWIKGH